ncbi:3755_t:CDS:2, partial [Racocetra persica]
KEKRLPEEGGSEELHKFFSNVKNIAAFAQCVYQVMNELPYANSKQLLFLNALEECVNVPNKTNIHEMIFIAFKNSINVIDFESLGNLAPILSFIIDFDDPDRQIHDYFRSMFANKYEELSKVKEPIFSAEVEEFLKKYAENKKAPSIRITDDLLIVARTWAKLTIDSFIEVITNDLHDNISVIWGDSVDQATKNCKTVTIDQRLLKKSTTNSKEKSHGKRPDSRICLSDEEITITLAYCEIAGPPFNIIDEFKWESD